jgi:hypothetical protein
MLDISALIETKYAKLPLEDVQKYFYPHTLEFITYIRNDGAIHRAEESRRDLDIFYTFQNWGMAENFAESKGIDLENIALLTQELIEIVLQCNRQTLAMIDPQWEEGRTV